MQVNAINSFSSVNFEARKNKPQKSDNTDKQISGSISKGFMDTLKGAALAGFFLVPVVAPTSCTKELTITKNSHWTYVNNECNCDTTGCDCDSLPPQKDTIVMPGDTIVMPGDTIVMPGDTIVMPGDTIVMPGDTIVVRDTIVPPPEIIVTPGDTVIIHDTITPPPVVIPPQIDTVYYKEFDYPSEIMDSLNFYRGEILDVPVEGDDGDLKNKVLLNLSGYRNWDYNKHETLDFNYDLSNKNEARFEHVIESRINNDVRFTKVKPGDVTIVRKDGTESRNVGGLMVNEDGVKTFIHSDGKGKIHAYPKATSGENKGKYVELGTIEPGYLLSNGSSSGIPHGVTVLLNSFLAEGTEDHYINVKGQVMDVEEFKKAIMDQLPDEQ